ncbi:related to Gim complex component GIM1 [Phialocephala subalpina]|uniref:Related to Gim complex component GIM1 n=1 Tax=Phialocephala subalpina TaxID=576137 RepID=A0A1L7XGP9_9HELO|nr:related to Gim complex component GIM1 [Phialocephala subalpina]
MADVQQRLQALSEEYQKLQTELQNNIQSGQKLESQRQENKGVQKEFAGLDDGANIYKLVGPVLLKQDKTEAVMAVDGRLEFIENEIKRVDKQIKDVQDKSDALRTEIIRAQTEAQEQGAQTQVAA